MDLVDVRPIGGYCCCGSKFPPTARGIEKAFVSLSKGYVFARYLLGLYYCGMNPKNSMDFEIKASKGMRLLKAAAEDKYIPAIRTLARVLCEGDPLCEGSKDLQKATSMLQSVERMGDPLVCFDLANIYFGMNNIYRYAKYLKLASENGHGESRGTLGRLYLGSRLKSKEEIMDDFVYAVSNSSRRIRGQYCFYLADLSRADADEDGYMSWLEQAAQSGHVEATYLLGCYYALGKYCEKNLPVAENFLEKARFLGHPIANHVLLRHCGVRIQIKTYRKPPSDTLSFSNVKKVYRKRTYESYSGILGK